MTVISLVPEPAPVAPPTLPRNLDPTGWRQTGPAPVGDPRALVNELHRIHRPSPGTVAVGVLDADGRLVGGASWTAHLDDRDGWRPRNAILAQLRQAVPHDLRRARPTRTAVLLLCRRGSLDWEDRDGAWMWALRDAAALHGLRHGAFVTLTEAGWRVAADGRAGRTPRVDGWSRATLHTVSELPPRAAIAVEQTAADGRPLARPALSSAVAAAN
ncbi:hypothetical protein [Streptacidiphilus monticola]|uniref:Uncharacterized protein n=1 Tax=Streptacidiphilus monticola TaxID=2161674 RepID=A0ABW1G5I4_9ACTN